MFQGPGGAVSIVPIAMRFMRHLALPMEERIVTSVNPVVQGSVTAPVRVSHCQFAVYSISPVSGDHHIALRSGVKVTVPLSNQWHSPSTRSQAPLPAALGPGTAAKPRTRTPLAKPLAGLWLRSSPPSAGRLVPVWSFRLIKTIESACARVLFHKRAERFITGWPTTCHKR